jgi:hypothetical protein
MQYKPKSLGALHIALGGLPGNMRIEVEPGVAVSAKPSASSEGDIVAREFGDSNAAGTRFRKRAKVSKASVATHYPPRR